MRIAVVSTVYKATPPVGYGGIERVVHTLVEELVRQGHDVTLFGVKGSYCSGQTITLNQYNPADAPSGITSAGDAISEEPLYQAMRAHVTNGKFDVIHDWSFENLFVRRHPEAVPFVISTCIPTPPGYDRRNVVASSAVHARRVSPTARHVHYGLNLADWEYRATKSEPMIHIAKIARYKGQHEAILAARAAHRSLKIAGNVEDRLYYWGVVRPLVALSPRITALGEVKRTGEVLKNAAALVQTPKWFDAFPLVVLEAMACGTPVVAYAEGGLVEQIEPGVNGFLCRSQNELAEAMGRVAEIKPADCRAVAEERFNVARMASNYAELYERVAGGETW
jgi:glycosyltransferase involved in cell wall biosynthesis